MPNSCLAFIRLYRLTSASRRSETKSRNSRPSHNKAHLPPSSPKTGFRKRGFLEQLKPEFLWHENQESPGALRRSAGPEHGLAQSGRASPPKKQVLRKNRDEENLKKGSIPPQKKKDSFEKTSQKREGGGRTQARPERLRETREELFG